MSGSGGNACAGEAVDNCAPPAVAAGDGAEREHSRLSVRVQVFSPAESSVIKRLCNLYLNAAHVVNSDKL